MSEGSPSRDADLNLAAWLFAVDPFGLKGVLVRGRAGPNRDAWVEFLRRHLPESTSMRRLPMSVTENRLLGRLDLAATLKSGRPVAERGLLSEANAGILLVPTAERLSPTLATHLTAALDRGAIWLERDGLSERSAARFGVVALDEGIDDEATPGALAERLALHIDVDAFVPLPEDDFCDDVAIAEARTRLPSIAVDDACFATLCTVAMRLGVNSLRAPLLAVAAARAAAALAGRHAIEEDDMMLAARLVLAPRATILPVPEAAEADPPSEPQTAEPNNPQRQVHPESKSDPAPSASTCDDMILDAAVAAIPDRVFARLKMTGPDKRPARSMGKVGLVKHSNHLGRPTGVRAGPLRDGVRLNIVETLRAAAPWQALRRRDLQSRAEGLALATPPSRIEVRADDFRITRYRQRTGTVTIFVVDGSGSSAFNRLAEVKGAVELLLGECYVRRDQVALITFRGRAAELILPPTRSLVRAKRCLAELPGGGATPLAAALDSVSALAESIRRKGHTPVIILMTDGQANIASDGTQGRQRAIEDAVTSGRRLRLAAFTTLLIDTSPRARPGAARLAAEMGAEYAALPYANALALSKVAARSRA